MFYALLAGLDHERRGECVGPRGGTRVGNRFPLSKPSGCEKTPVWTLWIFLQLIGNAWECQKTWGPFRAEKCTRKVISREILNFMFVLDSWYYFSDLKNIYENTYMYSVLQLVLFWSHTWVKQISEHLIFKRNHQNRILIASWPFGQDQLQNGILIDDFFSTLPFTFIKFFDFPCLVIKRELYLNRGLLVQNY